MLYFDWNEAKNEQLKVEREIGFEDVIGALVDGKILEVSPHPDQKKSPNQWIYIVQLHQYAYLVPFVKEGDKIFLKTIIPSRRATKKYLINQHL